MRILHILRAAFGATWAYEQVRVLRSLGLEMVVALPPASPSELAPMAPRYRATGASVTELDLNLPLDRPWLISSVLEQCRRLVSDVQPDLIHTHHVGPTLAVRMALGRRSAIPRVFGVTGTLHLEQDWLAWVEKQLAGPNDFWIATCRWTQRKYAEFGIPFDRVFLAYLGTDIRNFQNKRTGTLRAQLGISADTPLVGMVSLIYPPKRVTGADRGHKGHEDFIAALARLREIGPDVRGVIIGGLWGRGKWYEERIRYLGKKLCGEALTFLGTRADLPELYPDLDLAVVPSYSEGVAFSVVEPLLAGVPVVATKVGGLPDVIRDEETGWLVPPGNLNALVEAMRDALQNPGECRRRVVAGQALARQLVDAESTGRVVFNVYRQILSRVGQVPAAAVCGSASQQSCATTPSALVTTNE